MLRSSGLNSGTNEHQSPARAPSPCLLSSLFTSQGGSYYAYQESGKEKLLSFYQQRLTSTGYLKYSTPKLFSLSTAPPTSIVAFASLWALRELSTSASHVHFLLCSGIFDYFIILFAAYPIHQSRKSREEKNAEEKKKAKRRGGNYLSHFSSGTQDSTKTESGSRESSAQGDKSPKTPKKPKDPVILNVEAYPYLLQLYLDALFSLSAPSSGAAPKETLGGWTSTPTKTDTPAKVVQTANFKRSFVNIDRNVEASALKISSLSSTPSLRFPDCRSRAAGFWRAFISFCFYSHRLLGQPSLS